ncbi:MAG: hypothetical protein ACRDNG_06540, partial [Gaiellaceae bacterium]
LTPVLVTGAVLVIGLGGSLAAFPAAAISFPTRLAAVFGLGCAVVIFIGTVLVLLGAFNPISAAVVAALVTGASFYVGLRRSGWREHLHVVREELEEAQLPLLLGLGVLVFVAIAWMAVPELPMRGAWRYWSDGLELADRGGVPEFTAQWGSALPVAMSKLGGNAFLGELSFVFRDSPFVGMAVASWLSVVGYATGLFALGRELGLRWTAPALPLLGIASSSFPGDVVLTAGRTASKLEFFELENLGRMLAAVAAAIIVSKGTDRSLAGRMTAGGVVLSAAALTHLIPAVAFAALIGGVILIRIATEPGRRQVAWVAGGAAAIAVALTVTPLAAARGEVGFQGAGGSGRYTLYEGRYDPTAGVKGLRIAPRAKSEARWYKPPSTTVRLTAQAAVGRTLGRSGLALLAVFALGAAALTVVYGSHELRLLVGGATAMGLAILGIALLFSYRYSLYAQATFGERRLFEYASIPLILLLLGVLEVGAARVASRSTIASRALALGLVLVGALAVGNLGTAGKDLRKSDAYLAAAATTPCDSRLLVLRG